VRKQHTIKDIVEFSGLGVHTGLNVNVVLKPLSVNSGIIVNRVDKKSSFIVDASTIVANTRNTTLGNGDVVVQTIEHFMFAFYQFGITNIEIEIDNEEFPIFDGSARKIIDELASVGVVEQNGYINEIIVDKIYELSNKDSEVKIEPSNKFELDLIIDFSAKEIGICSYKYSETDSLDEIGKARTFVLLSELKFLLDRGLSKTEDINCAYIVKDIEPSIELVESLIDKFHISKEEIYIKLNELETLSSGNKNYIPEELVKHKVLDFLGDMFLTNSSIKGKITIRKPGHLINGQVSQLLKNIKK